MTLNERCTQTVRRSATVLVVLLAAVSVQGETARTAPPLVIMGPEHAADVEAGRAAAEAAIEASEQAMNRHLDRAYRARLIEALASNAIGGAANLLGETSSDLVYTPVTPCRVFDTRLSGGALIPGASRSFVVAGVDGFETQGGQPGGCSVPLGPATAVVVNLTAVNPSGLGHLRAWAAANPPTPPPSASTLNFGIVSGLSALANGLVLPICDRVGSGGSCPSDLSVQAFGSSMDVVGDVLGYFRKADLKSAVLVGASTLEPTSTTAGTLHLGFTIVTTPPGMMACVLTCSITVTSAAPNVTGQAYVQAGASAIDFSSSIAGGTPTYVPSLASSGSSSTTTVAEIGVGGPFRFKFGCYVSAAGDFLGDTLNGTVSWVCR